MWNPNSENKLKDVSTAETTGTQQQLNIVDNKSLAQSQTSHPSNISGNGKTSKITKNFDSTTSGSFGGGGGSHCASDSCSGGVDSGFLSGPQLFEDYDNNLEESTRDSKTVPSVQLNIVQNKKITDNYQDSGCIDEDYIEEEENQKSHQNKQKPSIKTTAATPQIQQRSNTTTNQEDQMILDGGVDSGVSEWFCKLTLRDPTQQVNNLGATGQRKSQKTISNDQDSSDTSSWEIYYQQNNEGDTQLHLACITGYVDVVAALIRMAPHPCLFNIQNDEAQTSLHLAVIYGQPKILRMLLIAGAEPTARDRHGNTPLHLACITGDNQCVKALTIPISASEIHEAHRSYGHLSSDKTTSYLDCARLPADLEIRNYDGERCVHLAAQGGHINILRDLVWFGADINAREGKSGRTPLHIAIECCNEVLANFLLEECSKLNLETATYAGLTAYQVACILNNPTMQNYLEKRGAETLTPPESDYESSDIETDLDDSQMYDRFGDPRYFANYNGGNPINVA